MSLTTKISHIAINTRGGHFAYLVYRNTLGQIPRVLNSFKSGLWIAGRSIESTRFASMATEGLLDVTRSPLFANSALPQDVRVLIERPSSQKEVVRASRVFTRARDPLSIESILNSHGLQIKRLDAEKVEIQRTFRNILSSIEGQSKVLLAENDPRKIEKNISDMIKDSLRNFFNQIARNTHGTDPDADGQKFLKGLTNHTIAVIATAFQAERATYTEEEEMQVRWAKISENTEEARVNKNLMGIRQLCKRFNLSLLVAMAILHDIGKYSEFLNPAVAHEEKGFDLINEYGLLNDLVSRGCSIEDIEIVKLAIKNHVLLGIIFCGEWSHLKFTEVLNDPEAKKILLEPYTSGKANIYRTRKLLDAIVLLTSMDVAGVAKKGFLDCTVVEYYSFLREEIIKLLRENDRDLEKTTEAIENWAEKHSLDSFCGLFRYADANRIANIPSSKDPLERNFYSHYAKKIKNALQDVYTSSGGKIDDQEWTFFLQNFHRVKQRRYLNPLFADLLKSSNDYAAVIKLAILFTKAAQALEFKPRCDEIIFIAPNGAPIGKIANAKDHYAELSKILRYTAGIIDEGGEIHFIDTSGKTIPGSPVMLREERDGKPCLVFRFQSIPPEEIKTAMEMGGEIKVTSAVAESYGLRELDKLGKGTTRILLETDPESPWGDKSSPLLTMCIMQAICNIMKRKDLTQGRVFIGHGPRQWSRDHREAAAKVFAANGIQVLIDESNTPTPTPAIGYLVFYEELDHGLNLTGASGKGRFGIQVFTEGGELARDTTIEEIILEAKQIRDQNGIINVASLDPFKIDRISLLKPYAEFLKAQGVVDPALIRRASEKGFKMIVSSMGGAIGAALSEVADALLGFAWRDTIVSLHDTDRADLYGVTNPDPSLAEPFTELALPQILLKAEKNNNLCALFSPDGGRIGFIAKVTKDKAKEAQRWGLPIIEKDEDEAIVFISPNHLYPIILFSQIEKIKARLREEGKDAAKIDELLSKYLVGKNIVTTNMLFKIAEYFGCQTAETDTGSQHLAELSHQAEGKKDIDRILLIAEESGGALMGGQTSTVQMMSKYGNRISLIPKAKDPLAALFVVLNLAAELHLNNQTLVDYYINICKTLSASYFSSRKDIETDIKTRDDFVSYYRGALEDTPPALSRKEELEALYDKAIVSVKKIGGTGIKITFADGSWIGIKRSKASTPIIRIHTEARTKEARNSLEEICIHHLEKLYPADVEVK